MVPTLPMAVQATMPSPAQIRAMCSMATLETTPWMVAMIGQVRTPIPSMGVVFAFTLGESRKLVAKGGIEPPTRDFQAMGEVHADNGTVAR